LWRQRSSLSTSHASGAAHFRDQEFRVSNHAARGVRDGRDLRRTSSAQGNLAILFGLQFLLPILPDPYAANVTIPVLRLIDVATLGPMVSRVGWTGGNAPKLRFDVPPNALAVTKLLQPSAVQSAGSAKAVIEKSPGIVLLDLSTNVDQFGVRLSPPIDDAGVLGSTPLAVDSLFLEGASNSVSALAGREKWLWINTLPARSSPVVSSILRSPAYPGSS
jgi:hypothetical protein